VQYGQLEVEKNSSTVNLGLGFWALVVPGFAAPIKPNSMNRTSMIEIFLVVFKDCSFRCMQLFMLFYSV
jgi:hypothetical protein